MGSAILHFNVPSNADAACSSDHTLCGKALLFKLLCFQRVFLLNGGWQRKYSSKEFGLENDHYTAAFLESPMYKEILKAPGKANC